VPDLAGGTDQVGVIQLRRDIVFVGLGEEPTKTHGLFEERQGDIERLLPLLDPQRKLPATQARADVIVTAHAEGSKRSACSRLPVTATTIEGRSIPSGSRPSNCRLGWNIICRCGPALTRCHPASFSGMVCCIRCGCGCSDIFQGSSTKFGAASAHDRA
jgi:hypothetical protein